MATREGTGSHGADLIRGKLLATNTLWSLLGQVLPAVVGIATIPFIVGGLGEDRFGLLLIAWMVVGYFSLIDFGLGRAVTNAAATILGSPDRSRLAPVVWTAWYLMGLLGLIGGIVAIVLLPRLIGGVIDVPAALETDARTAFVVLAIGIPVVVLTSAFRGLLEANQRFGILTAVRVPIGIATYLVPLAALAFTTSITAIVVGLVMVRAAGCLCYASVCYRMLPEIRQPRAFDRDAARELLGFGIWMTVSNVVRPLMVNVDRFFVGGLLTLAAVTYYATPFEAITKLSIVPASIAAVLFPAFSTAATVDPKRLLALFRDGVQVVALVLAPVTVATVLLAPELLGLWLGPQFAERSATVLQVLTVGVFTNSMAWMAYALVQGMGRSDITAKIHMVLAPLYILTMVALIKRFGINGAAYAWALRTTVEMGLLHWQAGRMLPGGSWGTLQRLWILLPVVPLIALGNLADSTTLRAVVAAVGFTVSGSVALLIYGSRVRRGFTRA